MARKKPAPKMGRPPKDPDDRKSEFFNFRVTPADVTAFERAASAAGYTDGTDGVGTWAREILLEAVKLAKAGEALLPRAAADGNAASRPPAERKA